MDNGIKLAGSVNRYGFKQADAVYSVKGLSPTILAYNQGQIGHQINILEENDGEMQNGVGDPPHNDEIERAKPKGL